MTLTGHKPYIFKEMTKIAISVKKFMLEMSGVLCLKWNNHTTTFIHSLDSLQLKESYCDATIACCGRYYPVHRFVLGTCSDYFEEVFSRTPCKHPYIILKDVNDTQLEALLNYMYKGEVNVQQENLPDLIRAAEALKVKGLTVSEHRGGNDLAEDCHQHLLSPEILKEKSKRIASKVAPLSPRIDKLENVQENIKPFHNQQDSLPCENSSPVNSETQSQISITNEESGIIVPHPGAQEDVPDFREEGFDIKCEPIEAEEEGFQPPREDQYTCDDPNFTSDKNSTTENSDIGNGSNSLEIPQYSGWAEKLVSSDVLSKEILEAWFPAAESDSLSLDDLHYLATNGDVSPSYSPVPDIPSLDTKKKTREKSSTRSYKETRAKYQCSECSFRTNDKAAFRLHEMRKHTGEKPFACTLCSYRCTTKDMLKIHTRKHTGERPFSCPYCSCRMAVKSSLKRHILLKHIQPRKPKFQVPAPDPLIKTGTVKAYKCSFCSYESHMKSNLKLHCMRIHTGEKPVACTVCTYRTTTKAQLEKHMRKHTGEKPFSCTFCSYKASQKTGLLRHMTAVHIK